MTIAELGAAFPQAGGLTVYLREAFGAPWGFLYGWALFVVIQTAAIAAVGVAFATYCGHFFRFSPLQIQLLAAVVVAVLSLINALGVREGVITQNVFTVAKLAVMFGLVLLALFGHGGAWSNLTTAPAGRSRRADAGRPGRRRHRSAVRLRRLDHHQLHRRRGEAARPHGCRWRRCSRC